MREILPPGGRGRQALNRIGRPLPGAIRSFISDAVARWDYSRKERRIASAVEAWEDEWEEETGPADGIPVPPARIRIEVSAMRGRWLKGGSTDAKLLREMLRRHGSPIEAMDAILDFGCGCGRVARHWAKLDGPEIHGADISRPSVRWCRRNLRFMHAYRSGLEPPLRFASGTFDFIYALSVLTHLPEHTGRRWLAELVRILKPGGLLLFTVHGERFLDQLNPQQRSRFRSGEFLVVPRPETLAGTNAYASFHPSEYVMNNLLPPLGVDLVEYVDLDPIGDRNTPMTLQDNYLIRKRPDRSTQ